MYRKTELFFFLQLLLSHFSRIQLCATPQTASPPGSAVPGILQARTLEWVAITFSIFPTDTSKRFLKNDNATQLYTRKETLNTVRISEWSLALELKIHVSCPKHVWMSWW